MEIRLLLTVWATLLGFTLCAPLIIEGPVCPKGTYPGFESTTEALPLTLSEVRQIAGSFFDCKWYIGAPANSTHGRDNNHNSVRVIDFAGTLLNEKLVTFIDSGHEILLSWTLDNGPLEVPATGLYWGSYVETLKVTPICAGKAAWATFTTTYCMDNVKKARIEVFHDAHTTAMKTLRGSKEKFDGCGSVGTIRSSSLFQQAFIGD